MLVVTAIADEQGDYESMKQITRVEPSGTTLSYHADLPQVQNSAQKQVDGSRTVLAKDLLSAHDYAEHFGQMIRQAIRAPQRSAHPVMSWLS